MEGERDSTHNNLFKNNNRLQFPAQSPRSALPSKMQFTISLVAGAFLQSLVAAAPSSTSAVIDTLTDVGYV